MPGVVSHFLLCAEKLKGKTDSTGDGADTVIYLRLIVQDVCLLCIKSTDEEGETVQTGKTDKDFPLLDTAIHYMSTNKLNFHSD